MSIPPWIKPVERRRRRVVPPLYVLLALAALATIAVFTVIDLIRMYL